MVFDLAETVAIAKEMIAKEGLTDRVSVQEGDWDLDWFGANNDVVLLSDVMHGAGSGAQMKLEKAYETRVSNRRR